jgi:hypothetical protein
MERMVVALRATSRTLADFLQARFEADPELSAMFGGGGTMRVYLNTPAEMKAARSGLSVWLYRVVRDESTLNRPPIRVSPSLTRRAPLPVKLHYLVTPITNLDIDDSLESEQVILGKVLQSLEFHPQLSGTDLKDAFAGTDTVVTARLEMLSVDELSRIWDALETSYRTSVSYEVTVVEIETIDEPTIAAPVQIPLEEVGILVEAI